MAWIKKGLIYVPSGMQSWSRTHAQVPVADFIPEQNMIRIYFATRNDNNQSATSFIEVDADSPEKVRYIHDSTILAPGKIGTFDDCGAMPSWVINMNERKYLYYIGWNVRNTVPYHNSVGLAISNDGGKTFKRFSEGPLWDRDYKEPYFSASTCVIKDGDIYKNWYLSCTGYFEVMNKWEPRYHIKYAESVDGIHWKRDGIVAVDYSNDEEGGLVKASVVKDDTGYKMWFAYRSLNNYRTDKDKSYKIGYAESRDGILWNRKDEQSGIQPSELGWDAEMITYPHIIDVKKQRIMFYNGNGFGKTGFGYAVWKGH